jgi:predicted dehydrogenase
VEDTAVVLLRLENGALVTISLSDTVAAPWSWDLASGENPAVFPQPLPPVNTHYISGTEGSLTLPGLELWRYDGKRGWQAPLSHEVIEVARGDPYAEQLRHLARVVRGKEEPLVSAADGTRTLRATLAVQEAARSGRPVILAN